MRFVDIAGFAWTSLKGTRTRTLLMVLAMAIGVAAVVILTSLGEGARRYVVGQFSSLGTHLVIVFPGKTETGGGFANTMVGRSPRDLTIEDALAVSRSRYVTRVAPLSVGTALMSFGRRSREVPVLGSTASLLEVRKMTLAQGSFLPPGDARNAVPVCVLGWKVREELFGASPALGQSVRIGDRRFRVIGVLATQGQSLGFNTDEFVVIPVASAQQLFNSFSLLRILVEAKSRETVEKTRADVIEIIKSRHEGEEDVTVVTQDAVLATFDRILRTLTFAVAGILIMNVMLISVSQRMREIGLLKALGAAPAQIRNLFFAEAAMLSLIGAIAGLLLGEAGSLLISQIYPALPAGAPLWAVAAALGTALATGIGFSVMPARRAARLDPVASLARR